MTARPKQTDCRYEPPYPDHCCVVFAVHGGSDVVVHLKTGRCCIEYPHFMKDCGEFDAH